jgi:hypothetical protein
MKFNQWTLGLAAVGVISLASAAQAEESAVPLMTALSATTISGYVDTSAQWNFGTGTGPRIGDFWGYKFSDGKNDGFNLNVVQLSIAKPLDESEWAAGYKVDLWMGPDANALGTSASGDFALRQAYVALRAPVGNGIDFKVGVFDTIIGYESLESGNNPNYTRSWGHSIEPQTHTGVLATYRFTDYISAAVGVANTVGPFINERAQDWGKSESYKTYMGSIALTAPDDWGFLAGSTLYAGVVNGFNSSARTTSGIMYNPAGDPLWWFTVPENQTSWYAGATLATPVTGLKLGAAFDYLDVRNETAAGVKNEDAWAAGVYASFQATEKLSFHARGELLEMKMSGGDDDLEIWSLTGTVQYDLWQNVISRVEVRWDRGDEDYFTSGSNGWSKNAIMLAGNVIYKF